MTPRRLFLTLTIVISLVTNATPASADVKIDNHQAASIGGSIEGIEVFHYGNGTQHLFDDATDFGSGDRIGDVLATGDTMTLADEPLDWWDGDWQWRQCVDLSASNTLAEYPFRIVLDTSVGSAEDIRVVEATNPAATAAPLPHYVESGYGTAETVVWFRAPADTRTTQYCVYFGSAGQPSTSNEVAPFTYEGGQTVNYYTMLDTYRGSGANSRVTVVSYSDNNVVSDGTSTVTLDRGQRTTFRGLDEQSVITATGPIDGTYDRASRETLLPEGYADAQFSFPTSRYTERFWVRSPHQSTTIEVLVDGSVLQSVPVTPGIGAVEIIQEAGPGRAYVSLRSTDGTDFLAIHAATNDQDIGIGVPWFGDTLYGVGSTRLQIGTTADTTVNWIDSDGNSSSPTITTSQYSLDAGNGPYGSRPSHAVSGADYFAAWQQADSNGTEVTSFLPERLLSRTYRFPVTIGRYVSVACPVPGTQVTFNGTTQTCDGVGVGHTLFGYGSYAAGTVLTADEPVFVYFETSADEHNLLGVKSAIPYLRDHLSIVRPGERLGEPCGSWISPVFTTGGIFGLTSIDLTGASSHAFDVAFDGGSFAPVGTYIDYANDGSATSQIRVTWCGPGATLSSVGVESDLPELATGVFTSTVVTVDGAGPVLRVYPSLATSWIEGSDPTGGPEFDIDTDRSAVHVSATGGSITNPSPPFTSAPYSVEVLTAIPQTSTIDLALHDEGSSVTSEATLSLTVTIP